MTEKIFVTQLGYAALLNEKDALIIKLREVQFKKGKAAANDTNSWHDNAEFDVYAQEEKILGEQAAQIVDQLERALVIKPPTSTKLVEIGHIITIQPEEGQEKVYLVGGYRDTDLTQKPPKLSYDAPLIRPFLAASVGQKVVVNIRGIETEYTLVAIS